MVIPDTVVGSAVGAGATLIVGLGLRWRSHRNGRNGKNGGCPADMRKAHGIQIAGLVEQVKAIQDATREFKRDVQNTLKEIKTELRELRDLVLSRLPKP